MNILALDPATRTGFAHSDGAHGVLNLDDCSLFRMGRLRFLRRWLREFHADHPFDVLAYERASFGATGGYGKEFHGQLSGVLELVADELGARTIAASPATIKALAGGGRFGKEDMIRAARLKLGIRTTSSDEADALWILEWAKQNPYGARKAGKAPAKRAKARQGRLWG